MYKSPRGRTLELLSVWITIVFVYVRKSSLVVGHKYLTSGALQRASTPSSWHRESGDL